MIEENGKDMKIQRNYLHIYEKIKCILTQKIEIEITLKHHFSSTKTTKPLGSLHIYSVGKLLEIPRYIPG